MSLPPKVDVFVRKRPMNKNETKKKNFDVVTCVPGPSGNGARCVVHEPKKKVDLDKFVHNTKFNFDMAFGEDCTNEELYDATVRPLLKKMMSKVKQSRISKLLVHMYYLYFTDNSYWLQICSLSLSGGYLGNCICIWTDWLWKNAHNLELLPCSIQSHFRCRKGPQRDSICTIFRGVQGAKPHAVFP